ncbi:bifunctional NAD(P)H-hydrate repair enzyme [Planomonospora parontospora subsp. parontospora]|uniref:Bifunctional NAD(P)H-hydrate repair enzyme n=2 Tax=Planomonospora parontospora TaxID=58119 RepID=A0AA37BDP6_9ACTN|nr:NAD(P)H-hydrate dehydratase [Planomonospora parontospora]GGK55353.1 bifunctional NAD(P)H-hydrate repair enzyme [Planomonospora parontospora]GII07395.1 bifunctional NAD(P)H-hydrate repair enzyme [Planomonospora parontospora subsp. parontospora]
MRTAYTSDQIRAAEAALMATLPEGTLMERAAAGLAVVCARTLGGTAGRVYGTRVVLLVGGGDNGGDALYAGARLAARGARVDAVLAGSRVHSAGLAALRRAGGRVLDGRFERVRALADAADLVVDGLVGIGGTGALREPYATLARITAGAACPVVAVDVPSGVDADDGRVEGEAVRADVTVAFGALKAGLLVDPGAGYAGRLEPVGIGLEPYLPDAGVVALTAGDVALLLPRPDARSDKYRRGVVGIVAGSRRYTGAAVLCVGGAVRGGAGMVRYAGAAEPVAGVRARWPEAVVTELAPGEGVGGVGRVQAWVLGPGLGTDADAFAVARSVLAGDLPVLVDADGLTLLAEDRSLLRRDAPTLLTPHAGELSRLLGVDRARIEERRLEHVRRAAAELGATVLLKGSTTLVAQEGRPVRVNPTGSPWLATGGTGDVLAGLAGALLAAGLDCYDAASCAAYLHGVAGQDGPLAAGDVAEALPGAVRRVVNGLRHEDGAAKLEG